MFIAPNPSRTFWEIRCIQTANIFSDSVGGLCLNYDFIRFCQREETQYLILP